jgi:predicted alpha/beta-hydrolase family hydrolase
MAKNAIKKPQRTRFDTGAGKVSALFLRPDNAFACYVLAHGSGAGMTHSFMEAVAEDLSARGVATLRFQFPYMEKKSRRPDPPKIAEACVRAAVSEAAMLAPGLPLIAGGKSFGGRMTSQAQAGEPLPGVRGLAFLGFPLHPADKPATARGEHLARVRIPMLFLQGTRDKLAELKLLRPLCRKLKAELHEAADADHSFHVPVRSGRTDAEVRAEIAGALAAWARRLT